ncbi:MAG TPA: beta-glucosidase, partial [Chitinophagaceae bacterium]|nr:beta-glucosidase [Chitinophagaceae bacterium]
MSFLWLGCKKDNSDQNPPVTPPGFSVSSATIDGAAFLNLKYDCSFNPVIKFYFSTKIDAATVSPALNFRNFQGALISYQSTMSNGDSAINIIPNLSLQALTKYSLSVNTTLKSQAGGKLLSALTINFVSKIDSSDKFPLITEDALLTKVQEQTFKYFWDFGHPASGLARERNTSGLSLIHI